MKKRITKNIIALAILALTCFCLFFVFNFSKVEAEEVFFTDEIAVSGFSEDRFSYYSGERKSYAFLNEEKNYEATLVSEDTYSGNYSVSFSFERLRGTDKESMQMVVVLGDDNSANVNLNNQVTCWNTTNDDSVILIFTGTKCYIFDRGVGNKDKDGNSDPMPKYEHNPDGIDTLGNVYCKLVYEFYSKKSIPLGNLNVKLLVNTDGAQDTLSFYFSKTTSFDDVADYTINLHKKGVADGYLKFSQPYCKYDGYEVNQFVVKNINKDNIHVDNFNIKGDASRLKAYSISPYSSGQTSYQIYDNDISNGVNSSIVSTFSIDDSMANDNEKVFEMNFKLLRHGVENNSHTWGLAFAVDDKDLSASDKIEINRTGYLNASSSICLYQCTSSILTENLASATISYKVTGYKGGRVVVEFIDVKPTCPKNHSIEYSGVDFNGKFGFFVFNKSTLDGSYLKISDFTFNGNANAGYELDLSIENTNGRSLIVGDSVRLYTNIDTTMQIVSGDKFATLSGSVLTAKEKGTVIVRATSVDNSKLYADFQIEITDDRNFNVNYENEFFGVQDINDGQNVCDFKVTCLDENAVSINNTLRFSNVHGNVPALVTYDVPFTANYIDNTVFDISFVVKSSSRDLNYYFGIAFGQDKPDCSPLSFGTNALVINALESKIYKDGSIVEPNYVTKNKNEHTSYERDDFGCYCSELCPLTVRLVGKADGTLEYYRGITYETYKDGVRITKGTELKDLFATYSGFDFNGYVSLFAEAASLNEPYVVEFDNLKINANYKADNEFIPEIVDLGIENESQYNLLHTDRPIELKYYVYSRPNVDLYKEFKVEIIGGNASLDENNNLITKDAGRVYVKVSSVIDETRSKIIELNIGELEITDILIDESIFQNLTTESQEISVIPRAESTTSLTKYLNIKVEVLEGNVEIINNYMYVKGAGDVKLRFYSEYLDSVEKTVTFSVADANLQYKTINWTLYYISYIVPAVVVVVGIAVVLFFVIKRKKKKEDK